MDADVYIIITDGLDGVGEEALLLKAMYENK